MDCSKAKCYICDRDSYPCPHGHIPLVLTNWANSPPPRIYIYIYIYTGTIFGCVTQGAKILALTQLSAGRFDCCGYAIYLLHTTHHTHHLHITHTTHTQTHTACVTDKILPLRLEKKFAFHAESGGLKCRGNQTDDMHKLILVAT